MRRKLMLTLALGALLTVAGAAVAIAKFDTFRAGNLILKADGGVLPKALPKNKMVPVAVQVKGLISSADGAHVDAFRETTIDFDKNGTVNAKGLPTCKQGQIEATETKRAEKTCKSAIVGAGRAAVEVEFPESKPFKAEGPLVMFNAGVKGSKTLLLIHVYVSVPVPTAIVTTVDIKKVKNGRYGIRTVSKIPRIAGGSGSTISFQLKVKKDFTYKGKKTSYVMAKCADGRFQAKIINAIFKDEDGIPPGPETTTSLKGEVIRPCTPKG
jgi:hypothetical protein